MRSLLIALALIFATGLIISGAGGLPQVQSPTGVLRVIVRNSGTSEPIAGARVTATLGPNTPGTGAGLTVSISSSGTVVFTGQAPNPLDIATALQQASLAAAAAVNNGVLPASSVGVPNGSRNAQTRISGQDGVAVFDQLDAGQYSILVDAEGFVAATSSATLPGVVTATATVVVGPQLAEVTVLLASASSISGRVLDARGMPLQNPRVMIGTIGFRDGQRVFQTQFSAQPDGSGYYVVSPVVSGEYYVRVETAPLRGEVGSYYPGVTDMNLAMRIPVQANEQVVGIDFDVPNLPVFKVSGTVLNVPALQQPNGQSDTTVPNLSFVSADPRKPDPQNAPLLPNVRSGRGGEFEISLPAGLWDVFPVIPNRSTSLVAAIGNSPTSVPAGARPSPYFTGRVRVLVADRDIENVTVAIGASDVRGRIVVEGGEAAVASSLDSIRVSLLPMENTPSPLVMHVRAAQAPDFRGAFTFGSVPPGKYTLQLSPIPAGFYVADIRLGSGSIFNDGIITVETEQVEPVEVTLRRDGGTVVVKSGRSAASLGARSVLIPAGSQQANLLLYKNAAVGREPEWFFRDVAPGDYKVFAFEALPLGGAEQNAEFMEQYRNQGVFVRVAPGQTASVEVPWIASEP